MPAAVTAMVPLVIFPLTGVLTEKAAAAAYGDRVIMLFLGAFMMSKAIEHWGAHRRIAQVIVARIGSTSGPRMVLAILLATTLCSFWINNTAIALMMLPVALAVLDQDKTGKLAVPVLLSVAYGASIGGIGTPIGTAPNGVFQFNYQKVTGYVEPEPVRMAYRAAFDGVLTLFGHAPHPTFQESYRIVPGHIVPFHQWIVLGGIISILTMFAAWVILSWNVRDVTMRGIEMHGEWTTPQKRTLYVFGLAVVGWILRDIPYGGWSELLGLGDQGDMIVAVAAALAMFFIPSGEPDGSRLLDWSTAVTIPWGVLILFGGGLAIAAAFEASGLSALFGEAVTGIREWPPLAIIAALCLVVTFLSEVTSNTATANILMPILAAAAVSNGIEPALLMFPATISNSLAFMMPVGTPPNAIVYSTGRVRILDMVRYGFVLNLIGAAIVTLCCWKLVPIILGGEY
jgi:sodium-dependent dicarboxylate transporter 2/3/5